MKTPPKNRSPYASIIAFALFTALAITRIGAGETPAAAQKMPLEKRQGDVRVILLRTGPIVTTNSPPTFEVTYVVEIPNQGAFSDLHFYSTNEITLVARGKRVDSNASMASGSMDFKDLPRPSELSNPAPRDGYAMLAEEITFTGLQIQAKQIDIKIQFVWRGTDQLFDFKNVPVK